LRRNTKVKLRTPSYPLLTPDQRARHPPVYQPLVGPARICLSN
jgi:hypothetical protein